MSIKRIEFNIRPKTSVELSYYKINKWNKLKEEGKNEIRELWLNKKRKGY